MIAHGDAPRTALRHVESSDDGAIANHTRQRLLQGDQGIPGRDDRAGTGDGDAVDDDVGRRGIDDNDVRRQRHGQPVSWQVGVAVVSEFEGAFDDRVGGIGKRKGERAP